MRSKIAFGACMTGALLLGGAALAHHGWGDYDATKPITLSGPVEAISPGNPHATLKLKRDGKTWLAVLAPPTRMTSRGMAADTIKVGAEVKVEGYPKTDGEPEMRAERITMAGQTIELR